MAETEVEHKSRSVLPSPLMARRCRIPKLSRSTSVRTKGDPLEAFGKSDPRPLSLTLPSSKSKDFPWQVDRRFPNSGSVLSMPFQGLDDDRSSLKSFGSFLSYTSYASQSQNTEASLSRPVSRSHGKKYVLHCERHIGSTEEYLTPTQRKDKEIRQLKTALMRQSKICEEKHAEIERLKSEIERLHDVLSEIGNAKGRSMNSSQESDHLESLHAKNSLSEISFQSQVTDKSDFQSSIPVNNDDSGISNDMSISPQNSSEFSDVETSTRTTSTSEKGSLTDPTLLDSSSDSLASVPIPAEKVIPSSTILQQNTVQRVNAEVQTKDIILETSVEPASPKMSQELENFLSVYQNDLEQLKTQHKEYYQDLKEKFNDRVEDLMQKLGEANSRYFELRPMFDRAQDKIHSLESQLSEVQRDMETQEEWHNQMYLKMYRKGQEAARFEQAEEVAEFAQRAPKRASVPDLLRQLHQLEAELDQTKQLYREASRGMGDRQAEYTLRFLKDAVFYFLTKKDKEHLKAIQSILGFTDAERMAVAKAMKHRRL